MVIDGRRVVFMRDDGTVVNDENIGQGGMTEDGEIIFWEIKNLIRPTLKGKIQYCRIAIQRVYPCLEEVTSEASEERLEL